MPSTWAAQQFNFQIFNNNKYSSNVWNKYIHSENFLTSISHMCASLADKYTGDLLEHTTPATLDEHLDRLLAHSSMVDS